MKKWNHKRMVFFFLIQRENKNLKKKIAIRNHPFYGLIVESAHKASISGLPVLGPNVYYPTIEKENHQTINYADPELNELFIDYHSILNHQILKYAGLSFEVDNFCENYLNDLNINKKKKAYSFQILNQEASKKDEYKKIIPKPKKLKIKKMDDSEKEENEVKKVKKEIKRERNIFNTDQLITSNNLLQKFINLNGYNNNLNNNNNNNNNNNFLGGSLIASGNKIDAKFSNHPFYGNINTNTLSTNKSIHPFIPSRLVPNYNNNNNFVNNGYNPITTSFNDFEEFKIDKKFNDYEKKLQDSHPNKSTPPLANATHQTPPIQPPIENSTNKRKKHDKSKVEILKKWFFDHIDNPYPTKYFYFSCF